MFVLSKVDESIQEHWQRYGYQQGPNPRRYSHFYNYYHSQNYKYDVPPPNRIDPKMRSRIQLGVSIAVIIGFVMNFYVIRKISEYRDDQIRKKSEINSILLSHSRALTKMYGDELMNKLLAKEVKQMTVAEATEEYERRHRQD